MADDTYDSIALPILEAIAGEERAGRRPASDHIVKQLEADPALYRRELAALWDGRYLDGIDVSDMSTPSPALIEMRLLERGKRAIGEWPSEDLYQELANLLRRRIEEEQDPVQKNRLQRFLDGLVEAGTDIAKTVLAQVVQRQMGL